MYQSPRHRVFISYHHDDQVYKEWFIQMMGDDIVDESVSDGDIDDNISTETIRQNIRDHFIRDATVTMVLIGQCTWQRKHVDWEIGSSLRHTNLNPRCGLLGILLPNHSNALTEQYSLNLVPPRLADNVVGIDPYAIVYNWSDNQTEIRNWIHRAYVRRTGTDPNNGREQYRRNRSGYCFEGWSN